jgi:ubiquinone/menaquinone biosynthesis C-methylase UbiE
MASNLSANDYERSCTSFSLPEVTAALAAVVNGRAPDSLLDVGCGYGGIAATLRDTLGIERVHGVDIDEDVIDEARGKGVEAVHADVGAGPLPFEDGRFDLLTCFGMLDYLPWYDVAVREFSRVLVPGGVIAVALPNLAAWHNRLSLLFGYQPRDVEFCSVRTVGLAPAYRAALPVGHLHTPTTRAFREFMTIMGFAEIRTTALRPMNNPPPLPLRVIDALVGRFPSSSRRFLYVGRRVGEPMGDDGQGWWTGPATGA